MPGANRSAGQELLHDTYLRSLLGNHYLLEAAHNVGLSMSSDEVECNSLEGSAVLRLLLEGVRRDHVPGCCEHAAEKSHTGTGVQLFGQCRRLFLLRGYHVHSPLDTPHQRPQMSDLTSDI